MVSIVESDRCRGWSDGAAYVTGPVLVLRSGGGPTMVLREDAVIVA